MTETDEAARYERIMRLWNASTKGLIAEMNLKVDDASRAGVTIRMPFNPDFCIDEDATLLHGGVLTALLDSAFGLANYMTIDDVQTMATLDLRVEYLRPARSRADVLVFAECYRQTRHIAFSSGRAWFDGASTDEVARGSATFALTRRQGIPPERRDTKGAAQ